MTHPFDIEKEKAAIEKRTRRKRERELSDVRKLLSMPEGRRFLWRVLGLAGVFRGSYTGQANDTIFNEGRRDIGLLVLAEIEGAKPEGLYQMWNEATAERLREAAEQTKERTP